MVDRSRFADQAYLRAVQYRDSSKLQARAQLHAKYGRGDWFAWWARQIDWPARAEVLEVGCGAGSVWVEGAVALPDDLRLTLTDQSIGMVNEAITNVSARGRTERIVGATIDAQHLPHPDDTFDVVVANHMLYHVPDPALAVAELARVLRPDGVALVATNGAGHLRELWALRREVFPGDDAGDATIDVFGLQSGRPVLEAAFGEVELRRYPDTLRCTDPADVLAFVTSTPPGEDASDDELARLRAAIDARFAAGGGVFEVTKAVGLFVARHPTPSG